jgi:hypothetical protein
MYTVFCGTTTAVRASVISAKRIKPMMMMVSSDMPSSLELLLVGCLHKGTPIHGSQPDIPPTGKPFQNLID